MSPPLIPDGQISRVRLAAAAFPQRTFLYRPRFKHSSTYTPGLHSYTSNSTPIEIHCNLAEPNNIQVNWPDNGFHLTSLDHAVCTEDPAIDQKPRTAPFDTFTGDGTGRLNGVDGATINFVFVDAGEPGTNDTADIVIRDSGGSVVMTVSGNLTKGNQQTHPNNK